MQGVPLYVPRFWKLNDGRYSLVFEYEFDETEVEAIGTGMKAELKC